MKEKKFEIEKSIDNSKLISLLLFTSRRGKIN